jgi:hypothetical protein
VLSLLLVQSRSYADIAALLHIDERDVRGRAHRAAGALVATGEQPDANARAQIVDYLLGEQTVSGRASTRAQLASSPVDRAWARRLSYELAPLTKARLPAVPDEPRPESAAERPVVEATVAAPPRAREEQAGAVEPARVRSRRTTVPPPVADTDAVGAERKPHGARGPRAWPMRYRIGALVALAAVFILIAALSSGGSSNHKKRTTFVLTAAGPNPAAAGNATIERQSDGSLLLLLRAHGLKPNQKNAYAVWLFNSPHDARILGFVNPAVGQSGSFASSGPLPADADLFHALIVTVERSWQPTTPGRIILRSPLTLP